MNDHDEVLGRIRSGLLYTESEAAFQNSRRRADLIFEYNSTRPGDAEVLLTEVCGAHGDRAERVPEVVADDGEHFFTQADCALRFFVELRVVERDAGTASDLFDERGLAHTECVVDG